MRARLISFIFCIVISSLLYGQGATTTTSSAEKFNRRGYYKNDAVTKNNHEIVSDYDGNLMLHYSTPIELPYGLGGDFTITYNANVEHRFFGPFIGYGDASPYKYYEVMGVAINSPEWILGYKGFALQTFNFENYQMVNAECESYSSLQRRDTPLLIPGYHYGPFHGTLGNADWGNITRDYIAILRADGSKMVLMNIDEYSFEGTYIEVGAETKGYASVYIFSSDNYSYLRKIEYSPGDGFTYRFIEETGDYIDKDNVSVQGQKFKIVYLKQIIASNYRQNVAGINELFFPIVNFLYSSKTSNDIYGHEIQGRKLFHGLKFSHRCSEYWDFSPYIDNISNVQEKLKMCWNMVPNTYAFFSVFIDNISKGEQFKLTLDPLDGKSFSPNRDANKGRMQFVTNIEQKGITESTGRNDIIEYYKDAFNNLSVSRGYAFDPGGNINLHYLHYAFIPKVITYYNNAKTKFEIWDNSFVDPNPSDFLNLSVSEQYKESYNETGRDCFTNFILKNRKIYKINDETPTITEDYTYSKDGSTLYPPIEKATDNLITQINIIDNVGNTIKTSKKCYNYFLTSFKNYSGNYDSYKTSKLIKDAVADNSGNKYIKEYIYEIGSYIDLSSSGLNYSYWDGSFAVKTITETEIKGETTLSRSNEFSYEYDIVNYGSTLFSKKIINKQIQKDPLTFYTEKEYLNDSYYLTTELKTYTIGRLTSEKKYGIKDNVPPVIISHIKNQYSTESIQMSDGTWKLKNTLFETSANNQNSDRLLYTDYYYNNGNFWPFMGALNKTVNSKGIVESLIYPNWDYNTTTPVVTKIIPYEGENYNINKRPKAPSFKPWRKSITFDNSTYNIFTSYDSYGNLESEIDINGYYSEYTYDTYGRITKASFPGSFSETASIPARASVSYQYDDINNTIEGTSYSDVLLQKAIKYKDEYDAFGNLSSKWKMNGENVYEKLVEKKHDGFGRLISEEIFAEGTSKKVIKSYSYDYLDRMIVAKIGENSEANTDEIKTQYSYDIVSGSFAIPGSESSVNYVRKNTVTDPDGITVATYFDVVGKKVAEQIGTNNPTLFIYNEAYQLTDVITPEGLKTTYTYDQLGYLSSKTSPDEGTYKYHYNKYGELRYQFHTTQSPLVLLFHNYDKLGRLISTGTRSIAGDTFDGLDPDVESTDDKDQLNLILVNIYDDIANTDEFLEVFNDFSLPVSAEQINNTKGRLVATAYRDKTGDTWKYKLYSYDPMGNVEKTYLKEL